MHVLRRYVWRPVLPADHLGEHFWITGRVRLRRQFIERPVIFPTDHLRAGQLAMDADRFDEAIVHFRRALKLDPRLAQGHLSLAAAHLALAQDPEATQPVLRDAAVAFDAEGWGPKLTGELKELAFAPDGTPAVAALWAERAVAAGSPDAVSDLLPTLLAENPGAGREVVLAYLWALAEAGKPVQGAVTKYSEVLRADAAGPFGSLSGCSGEACGLPGAEAGRGSSCAGASAGSDQFGSTDRSGVEEPVRAPPVL